jgi:hypothetical protein
MTRDVTSTIKSTLRQGILKVLIDLPKSQNANAIAASGYLFQAFLLIYATVAIADGQGKQNPASSKY